MDNDYGLMEKVKFFFDNRISVHIVTNRKSFFNGLIIEFFNNSFVINDRLYGETPISFSELIKIERFKEIK